MKDQAAATRVPQTPTDARGYGAYNCLQCRKERNEGAILFNNVLAAVRIFAGVPGQGHSLAGGFAACEEHASAAVELAMRSFVRAQLHDHKVAKYWSVVGYAVELGDDGEPRLGKRLFVCRPKMFEETPRGRP